MISMTILPTMYRDTQNTDTPNLPFAQTRFSTMYRDTQNTDTPNLPFAQTTNGCLTCPPLQLSLGLCNCPIGGDSSAGSSGFTKSQIHNIIEEYHGDDIKRLDRIHKEQEGRITEGYRHRLEIEKKKGKDFSGDIKNLYNIHKEQEDRITDAYKHRKNIEGKVEKNISAFPNIHTQLSKLGKSVSDISTAFNLHKVHDIIPPIPPIPPLIPPALIAVAGLGVLVYFLTKRKKR